MARELERLPGTTLAIERGDSCVRVVDVDDAMQLIGTVVTFEDRVVLDPYGAGWLSATDLRAIADFLDAETARRRAGGA